MGAIHEVSCTRCGYNIDAPAPEIPCPNCGEVHEVWDPKNRQMPQMRRAWLQSRPCRSMGHNFRHDHAVEP
jgi:predicted RNA-binding Zn-ribbon protein involved in translation (DUF1610 family)